MQLIVKGTPEQAVQAAAERRIPLIEEPTTGDLPPVLAKRTSFYGEAILQVHECHRSAVIRWFNEPYNGQAGDLLFFS